MSYLPENLQQSIVPVKKVYGVSANSTETNISNDSIWTLSLNELTGQGDPMFWDPYPYSQEGQQYDAFKDRAKLVYVDDEDYHHEFTYSVTGLEGISKDQSGKNDTEFIWMRSLYNNWRTFDDFDDAALGISGKSEYPGYVYYHAAFDREQNHGICPCFCLGSTNDFELLEDDVYVSQWIDLAKSSANGYEAYFERTNSILKTYGNVSNIECVLPPETREYISSASFERDIAANFYLLNLSIKDDIPRYGVSVPIYVKANVAGFDQYKVLNIYFDE